MCDIDVTYFTNRTYKKKIRFHRYNILYSSRPRYNILHNLYQNNEKNLRSHNVVFARKTGYML